jgi:hypothetical protein
VEGVLAARKYECASNAGPIAMRLVNDGQLRPNSAGVDSAFDSDGYVLLRQVVDRASIGRALRLLNVAIRRHGLTAQEIQSCQQTTFFPHLRWEPEVWGVLPRRCAELLGFRQGDEWAEPQLLLRFPDEVEDWPLEPHLDEPPPWSNGRAYRGIVGVALTATGLEDGAPCIWPGSHAGPARPSVFVPMAAGDALMMHPALEHCGSLNRGAYVRAAIYFRLLGSS